MQLTALVADEDLRVRYLVAERGNAQALARLSEDPDPEVRRLARARRAMQADTPTKEKDDGPCA